jgi:hypothetical protein
MDKRFSKGGSKAKLLCSEKMIYIARWASTANKGGLESETGTMRRSEPARDRRRPKGTAPKSAPLEPGCPGSDYVRMLTTDRDPPSPLCFVVG